MQNAYRMHVLQKPSTSNFLNAFPFSQLYSTESVPVRRALPHVVRDVSFGEGCSAAVSEGDARLLNLIRYSNTSE